MQFSLVTIRNYGKQIYNCNCPRAKDKTGDSYYIIYYIIHITQKSYNLKLNYETAASTVTGQLTFTGRIGKKEK